MEPFGLFDLLKSLLPSTQKEENPPPAAPPSQPANTPASANGCEAEQRENNACLDFISRHDALAKRVKKTDR